MVPDTAGRVADPWGRARRREAFPTEFRLALACTRWPLNDDDRAEILELAVQPLDWSWFKRIVERNQILPLVYTNLCNVLVDTDNAGKVGLFRDAALSQTRHSMSQTAQLVRITDAVKSAGLETVALKGVTLAVLAYGNLAMRSTGDIDLFAPAAQIPEIERILKEMGYIRFDPRAELTPKRLKHYLRYYKHFKYSSHSGSPLELHWRLFHNTPLLKHADASEFASTVPVSVGSGTVRTLSRSELLLYLAVHGTLHGWPILKWLADIGALLRIMSPEELVETAALANERGLSSELRSALTLVEYFLAIQAPKLALEDEDRQVVDRIVAMALRLLTSEGYCLDIRRLPRWGMFFYDLRLRSSWRYRSEDLRRAFVLPDDWELIDLPDSLFPLYAAVRPVSWMIRHLPRFARRQSATN